MKKILVTGANGQLGQCLKKQSKSLNPEEFQFVFVGRNELDIANEKEIQKFLTQNTFDFLVNCAAYTAVDLAETDKEMAFKINAEAVGNLAKFCKNQDITFIHISTDYVFDGNANKAIPVDAKTNPINMYGQSKLKGEQLAMKSNPDSIIIRTAWVYSQFGKNFMKTMLRLFSEKDEISVVNDQMGTPTNANDIAQAILKVIQSEKKFPGIFHFTNAGETSWFEFAEAIKEFTQAKIKINPIPTSQFLTPAKRPAFSVLDTQKIQEVYQVQTPDWKESLKNLLTQENLHEA